MTDNKRAKGAIYERKASEVLAEAGLEVIEMNYRCRMGEIDIIARDGEYIVFVEVKYRKGKRCGGALYAVNAAKQHRVSRTAAFYLMTTYGSVDVPCRFDVIGIDEYRVTWIKDAFSYT